MGRSDEDEYVAYVTARGAGLRRTAYLLCGDWHRAQDIVQTAIAKLYVHWRRAVRMDNLDAYVRRIVVRVFLDEQRLAWSKVRRMASVPEPEAAHRLDADDRIVLLEALAKVPPRQRAVLVLRFWEDLSVEQTAEVLRCSTGNIKSQTARGLAAMRKLLPHPLLLDPVSGPAR
jgi:RNA polymerase sigma-70 factor (sigma-E family)